MTPSPQAQRFIQHAFERLEQEVKHDDARIFQSTTLHDVRRAVRQVEQQLAAQQRLRNLQRIQPFLDGLEGYSKPLEVLCNGTPFLPWVWVSTQNSLL